MTSDQHHSAILIIFNIKPDRQLTATYARFRLEDALLAVFASTKIFPSPIVHDTIHSGTTRYGEYTPINFHRSSSLAIASLSQMYCKIGASVVAVCAPYANNHPFAPSSLRRSADIATKKNGSWNTSSHITKLRNHAGWCAIKTSLFVEMCQRRAFRANFGTTRGGNTTCASMSIVAGMWVTKYVRNTLRASSEIAIVAEV